ncbi:MAG: hypothetical protein KC800_14425, partial [Candidatus Eremiobacteraeota bacterium]|nr:hypothetical protein [Candidatus Eremiobacteraeota bacterium]
IESKMETPSRRESLFDLLFKECQLVIAAGNTVTCTSLIRPDFDITQWAENVRIETARPC